MFTVSDLITILNGVIARREDVDVCLSCDWCDAAHTIYLTQVYIEDGALCLEDDDGTIIRIKGISDCTICADPIGREYHITQGLGQDWMFTLV